MKKSVLGRSRECLTQNYGQQGLEIVSGSGPWVKAREENGVEESYLDMLCGLGATSLGHCHQALVEAIGDQVRYLGHVSNLYVNEPSVQLAEKLVELSDFDSAKVFFCNSGTEANEAAVKLARLWGYSRFGPKKKTIIALKNGFHGRTWMSISLTGQAKMQEQFGAIVEGIRFANLNDIESLRAAVDDTVCAIIFETIQAEGGIHVMSQEFYDEINCLAKAHQFLKIADEVQTGIGRTGEMFCYQHYSSFDSDSEPDIVTMAKALGGGLPLGAMMAKDGAASHLIPGSHAATFGGNPICCAVGLAVLNVIEADGLFEVADRRGQALIADLKASSVGVLDKIKEIRGRGFMIGVELEDGLTAAEVVKRMQTLRVLVGSAGPQVVRFLPPLIATNDELALASDKFRLALNGL